MFDYTSRRHRKFNKHRLQVCFPKANYNFWNTNTPKQMRQFKKNIHLPAIRTITALLICCMTNDLRSASRAASCKFQAHYNQRLCFGSDPSPPDVQPNGYSNACVCFFAQELLSADRRRGRKFGRCRWVRK